MKNYTFSGLMQIGALNATEYGEEKKNKIVIGGYLILPCSPKSQNSWAQILAPMLSLHDILKLMSWYVGDSLDLTFSKPW